MCSQFLMVNKSGLIQNATAFLYVLTQMTKNEGAPCSNCKRPKLTVPTVPL